MSQEEAHSFGITEAERRRLIRMDSGKVNIAPPLDEARWFRLVGVPLDNGTDIYPKGDEVQTVEVWTPPDVWAGLSHTKLNDILTDIATGLEDGNLYTDANSATERAAWRAVAKHAPMKNEAEAKTIIRTWVKNGVLVRTEYTNPATRKPVKGLQVDEAKRPA